MRFLAGNAQNIGARSNQQDAFGFSDPADAGFVEHGGFCAVVCDGMGGMADGDQASRIALRTFLDEYAKKTAEEGIPAALLRSVEAANRAVVAAGAEMGSTLVAVVLGARGLFWISVGDSAIFLYRDGGLTMLNTPHTFAQELDQRAAQGLITADAAKRHPERESLTSYIGDPKLPLVDRNYRPMTLEAGDCVLLASDGLFKVLDTAAMAACMRGSLDDCCASLVEATLARGVPEQDNVTVIAVSLAHGVAGAAVVEKPEPVVEAPPIVLPVPPPRRARRRLRFALTAFLMVLAGAGAFWLGLLRGSSEPAAVQLAPNGAKYDPAKREAAGVRETPAEGGQVKP